MTATARIFAAILANRVVTVGGIAFIGLTLVVHALLVFEAAKRLRRARVNDRAWPFGGTSGLRREC
jgi:hypothetical protein